MQDAHVIDTQISNTYIDFGFNCHFSYCKSSSNDVFISYDEDFKLFCKYNDKEGNMLIL